MNFVWDILDTLSLKLELKFIKMRTIQKMLVLTLVVVMNCTCKLDMEASNHKLMC